MLRILKYLILILLLNVGRSQCNGCNHVWYWDECEEIVNPEDCNESDLQIIQDIIDVNGYTDQYTPLEFGWSTWEDGNLVWLNLFFYFEPILGIGFFIIIYLLYQTVSSMDQILRN